LIANQRFTLLASLLALLAAGCSSTVTMEMPTIPEPHMAKINTTRIQPIQIGNGSQLFIYSPVFPS
jgi:hypothetical protein